MNHSGMTHFGMSYSEMNHFGMMHSGMSIGAGVSEADATCGFDPGRSLGCNFSDLTTSSKITGWSRAWEDHEEH